MFLQFFFLKKGMKKGANNKIELISLPYRLKCQKCLCVILNEWIYCEHCGNHLQRNIFKENKEKREEEQGEVEIEEDEEERNKRKNNLKLIKIQNILLLQNANNFKQKKKNQKINKEKVEKIKKEKRKKEIEKEFQRKEEKIQNFEKYNKKLLQIYQEKDRKNLENLSTEAFQSSCSSSSPSSNHLIDSLNPILNSSIPKRNIIRNPSYLNDHPSIIDRLYDGFTSQEEEEVGLFWGKQQLKDKQNNFPSFFNSSFWGSTHENINEGNEMTFNEEDEEEIKEESERKNEQFESGDSITMIDFKENYNDSKNNNEINNLQIISEDHLLTTTHEAITISHLERIRRNISSKLLSVVQQMKWILKHIVIDVTKDPINFSKPLEKYQIKVKQLLAAINRTYEVELQVEDLSQEYLEYADVLRCNIAIKITKTQKRAEKLHQQCHKLYESISSGVYLNSNCEIDENHTLLTDSYLIQKNQERVLEHSEKILQPIRTEIHSNLLEENQLISKLKYVPFVSFSLIRSIHFLSFF